MNVTYENYLRQFSGGVFGYAGRVAVCHNGVFSSICDINWDQADANVFCNGLGIGTNYSK